MVTIYFRNEESARLLSATKVELRTDTIAQPEGTAFASPAFAVCVDDEGNEAGRFLLDQIVGWDLEEWEDDEDEDD